MCPTSAFRGLIVAADLDVERAAGSLGEVRDLAAGGEAKLFRRLAVRSGFRFNTLGDEPGGHAPVYSLGASVATYRQLLVDARSPWVPGPATAAGASRRGWCIRFGARRSGRDPGWSSDVWPRPDRSGPEHRTRPRPEPRAPRTPNAERRAPSPDLPISDP